MSSKNVEIVKENQCTGCCACSNACPKNAITMKTDIDGFWFPSIDNKNCIECGICVDSCPALDVKLYSENERICYATMADTEIRLNSSSGGVFSLLSEYVLNNGGYVCGAAWDENLYVQHKLINSIEELDDLRRSKYLASFIGDNFKRIKQLLDDGKMVLFSGCPCQVAGLQKFLKKNYQNLLTIDIICHGVPSPKAWQYYLEEIAEDRAISSVNFREKTKGWGTYIDIQFENGEYYHNNCYKDPYWVGFLNATTPRLACSSCQFAQFNRIGDITLGDFWGIGKYNVIYDDGKGTGLVLLNTDKGKLFFNKIEESLILKKLVNNADVIEIAKGNNAQLVWPNKQHFSRKRFFDLLNYMPFSKALDYANHRKFDVGIIGWWYSENYGSALTYYALHQLVLSLGLAPVMIEKPIPEGEEKIVRYPNTIPRRFARKHYEISKLYYPSELYWLNGACKTFISGSDQLFNYYLQHISGPTFYLDFVAPYNNIISYASSFGNDYYGNEKAILQSAYLLKRFKALSVRESYAVDICKNKFGLDATCVLDPVFMIDRAEYDKLVDDANIKISEDYIAVFMLDPDDEKIKLVNYISEKLNLPVHCLIDAVNISENISKINLTNVYGNADVEDWLSVMSGAKYIVTDSFHGTCFSIIFQKRFISIGNYKRGVQRFESLLTQFGLMDRLLKNVQDVYSKADLFNDINYENVFNVIELKRKESLSWLKDAIFNEAKVDANNDEFHVVDYQLTELKFEIERMRKEIKNLNEKIDTMNK